MLPSSADLSLSKSLGVLVVGGRGGGRTGTDIDDFARV